MAAYIAMLSAAMLLLLPVYLLLRWLATHRRPVKGSRVREVVLALFVLFCGAMAYLLFDGFYPAHWHPQSIAAVLGRRLAAGEDINLVPLRVIGRYFALMDGTNIFTVNLVGNVLMFAPLGLLPPLLWRRWQRWWKIALLSLLLPVAVETVQLLLPRSVDVDDVLLNALGIWAGWGLYCLLRRLFPRTASLQL